MIVVSDTTPLNYLILVDSVHVLPSLFVRVHAPSAVIAELSHSKAPETVRRWSASPPEWLKVQDPTTTDASLKLGSGETAAIALGQELKADWILIDERKGTREAQGRGLRVAGTLTILEEAGARGLLDYQQTIDRLVSETTFHLTDQVLKDSEQRYRDRQGELA